MRFAGKKALVTGAARGIGRSVAQVMAAEGADVAVADISEDLEAVSGDVRDVGRRVVGLIGDVSRREDVEAMVNGAHEGLGGLDILVNNAGIETITGLLELTDEEWSRVTDVNLRGSWMCSQVFVRNLVSAKRPGAIVNVGSVQAGLAMPGRTHYAPTKRGVEALTRNLAAELSGYGIRVNCVHPGVIETDMTRWVTEAPQIREEVVARIPYGRFGKPVEVAEVIAFLASEDASYVTGQAIYIDGGMSIM